MLNFSGSSKKRKLFSLTVAILFTFNSISWAAPIKQDTLRAISTGQRHAEDADELDRAQLVKELQQVLAEQPTTLTVPVKIGDFDIEAADITEESLIDNGLLPKSTRDLIGGLDELVKVLVKEAKDNDGYMLLSKEKIQAAFASNPVSGYVCMPGLDDAYLAFVIAQKRGFKDIPILMKVEGRFKLGIYIANLTIVQVEEIDEALPPSSTAAEHGTLQRFANQLRQKGTKSSSAGATEVIADVVTVSNELDVAVEKGIAYDSLLQNLKWWYEVTGKRKETITAEGVRSLAEIMGRDGKRLILALDIAKNTVLMLIRVVDPRPQVNGSMAGVVINRRHRNTVQTRPVIEINDEDELRRILDNAGLKKDKVAALDEFIERISVAPKPSSAGEVIIADDLTFKVSSEKLEGIKEANPEFAEDLSNLIEAIQGPKLLAERVAEIEKNRKSNKTDAADIRLLYLLRSLLKVAVFGDIYVALAKDAITKKEVPLLVRKEGNSYKTAVIIDMLPTDVMRIINKLGEGGTKKVRDFVEGRPTRPTQPLSTRLTSWSGFYFQLKNSGVEPSRIGVASLSERFSYSLPIPRKFKIGDIPPTMNDIISFPRQGECYKSINFNERNLIEDYWLRLEDMFTEKAIKELGQIHRKLRGYRFREEIRNLNIDLMKRIAKNRPEYKFITPSIAIFNIFFKRKDGSDYRTQAEIVLAVSRENRLVPVLVGIEGYTLPESIKAEPDITGPTLMAHFSEEAIDGILQALAKDSIEHAVYRAYATQQGATSKSSSAGSRVVKISGFDIEIDEGLLEEMAERDISGKTKELLPKLKGIKERARSVNRIDKLIVDIIDDPTTNVSEYLLIPKTYDAYLLFAEVKLEKDTPPEMMVILIRRSTSSLDIEPPAVVVNIPQKQIYRMVKLLPAYAGGGQRKLRRFAEQQSEQSKSSSAGVKISEFAKLEPIQDLSRIGGAIIAEQLNLLRNQILTKDRKLDDFVQGKYTIGPIKGLKNPISLIGPFSYTDDTQVALMAIEYSDKPLCLLAIGNDARLSLYYVTIKNMPSFEAIISQVIDSGSLPPEAVPAWRNYLEAHAEDIPSVKIETEQNPPLVYEDSKSYLAMVEYTQPELLKQLLNLASYIRIEPTAGVKKFRRYIQTNLEKLDEATFKDRGLIAGVTPRDYVFGIKAKDTDQTFIISRWSAISLPSQIGKKPQSFKVSDIERICVLKSSPKSSSAGTTEVIAGVVIVVSTDSGHCKNVLLTENSFMRRIKAWFNEYPARRVTAKTLRWRAKKDDMDNSFVSAIDLARNTVLSLVRVKDHLTDERYRREVDFTIGVVIDRDDLKKARCRGVLFINDLVGLRKILSRAKLSEKEKDAWERFIAETPVFPRPSSAGLADCVELGDLDLTELYFELREELESLQQGISTSYYEYFPSMRRGIIKQEVIIDLINKKNLQRIPLVIGPFTHGKRKLFLMLVSGKNAHRVIAIDSQDLKYLKVGITDKDGFRGAILNFMKELEKQRDDSAAKKQLEDFITCRLLWDRAVEEQAAKSSSAGVKIDDFAKLDIIENLYSTDIPPDVADALHLLRNQIIVDGGKLDNYLWGEYMIRSQKVKGKIKNSISLIGPFFYTHGIKVALMAIEHTDGAHSLLAISGEKKPVFYDVSVKNMTNLDAIISQIIDSEILRPEATRAWRSYLEAQAKHIPDIRIETELAPPLVYEASKLYLEMMKMTQRELYQQLIGLARDINRTPTAGKKSFQQCIRTKYKYLDETTLKPRGLIAGVSPRDFIFTVKTKYTNQIFLISCWSAISLPSQIGKKPQALSEIDRICVAKIASKSSSAGGAKDDDDIIRIHREQLVDEPLATPMKAPIRRPLRVIYHNIRSLRRISQSA